MKKITYLSLVAVFFLLSYQNSFAWTQTKVQKTEGVYQFTIKVYKGWNLIPLDNVGTFKKFITPAEQDNLESVTKALYVYLPLSGKYLQFLGGFNDTTLAEFQNSTDYLRLGAVWMYSNAERDIPYIVKGDSLDVWPGKLYKGWNLMTIPPQFFDKSYGWGSCDIEKIFTWDEIGQKWNAWPMDMDPKLGKFLEEASEGDFIGYGVAVKVRDSCSISKTGIQNGVVVPPNIPN